MIAARVAAVAMSASLFAATLPADAQAYYGLFVGVNEYSLSECEDLSGCDWDAMRMLDASTRGGFCAAENAEMIANSGATKAVVRAAFNDLASVARAGDTVLYYQSSHGGKYNNYRGAYLCLTDDKWMDFEFAEDLAKFASGVRVIVVLDACYSGGMFKSASGGASAVRAGAGWDFAACVQRHLDMLRTAAKGAGATGGPSVAWITAAEWNEESFMDIDSRGSEFTHAFLRGWQDASADSDSDGYVSFGELSEFAKGEVYFSSVQSDNDELLADTVAGYGYDVYTFRVLLYGSAVYGYCGRVPDGETVDLEVPDGMAEIADSAFEGLAGLRSLYIPGSVERIGDYAFCGCGGLTIASLPITLFGKLDTSVFLECPRDLLITYRGATETYKVRFGKNGGSGGDDYVTATYGAAMPTPRTAPTLAGWTFAGYWDTVVTDEKGNPKGKQYYDANMRSVRAWDKPSTATLWAKWVNKVTLGKNGGSGGDNYVTCTKGQPMPMPRTAPKRAGWTFAGYWDTVVADACGIPVGKQYYDANMKSVRSWDRKGAAMILWAKWTVRVTLGKNGGTYGDNYVTVTYNQPFPKRTMPKRTGYVFGGYWVSSNNRIGQCYNADGTGTDSMRWVTGGSPTVWALWTDLGMALNDFRSVCEEATSRQRQDLVN